MKTYIRRIALALAIVIVAGAAGLTVAAPVESVVGLDVHNRGAFMAALEKYRRSDEAQGNKVSIWRVAFGGQSDISHLAVASYDDYNDYQATTSRIGSSRAWAQFMGSLNGLADAKSRVMAVERFRQGSSSRDHGASTAFVMAVSDPGAYAAAFAELVDEVDNPGYVRLMELRFGGQGATHAVVIAAADSVALNEYLDELVASSAYRKFVGKVGNIRTILNVSMYIRVATFGD